MDPLAIEHQIFGRCRCLHSEERRSKGKDPSYPKVDGLFRPDVLLEIVLSGQKQLFVMEVKAVDRNIAVGQIWAEL